MSPKRMDLRGTEVGAGMTSGCHRRDFSPLRGGNFFWGHFAMILLKEYAILVVIYYKTPSSLQREAYVDFWYFSQMALVETFE